MGNICRSPTAEGVFRRMVEARGLNNYLHIDSAGTHGYHTGCSPDPRSASTAAKRGYDLSSIRSRRVEGKDFQEFDYLIVMDQENFAYLKALCPSEARAETRLLMEFSKKFTEREVPDPYYGGTRGFERVLEMVEDASEGFLEYLLSKDLAAVKDASLPKH